MKKKRDEKGIEKFVGNRIVRWCLENDTDLNQIWELAEQGIFTRKEMKQFYKLIGYSVVGYEELDFRLLK